MLARPPVQRKGLSVCALEAWTITPTWRCLPSERAANGGVCHVCACGFVWCVRRVVAHRATRRAHVSERALRVTGNQHDLVRQLTSRPGIRPSNNNPYTNPGPVPHKPKEEHTTVVGAHIARRDSLPLSCFATSFQGGGSEGRGRQGAQPGFAGSPWGWSLCCEWSLHPTGVPYFDEGIVGSRD